MSGAVGFLFPALLHIGGDFGFNIWTLLVLGIVANAALHGPKVLGLLVRGPLTRGLARWMPAGRGDAAGPHEAMADGAAVGARHAPTLGRISLPPRRGLLEVEGVAVPGVLDVERVEAELTLVALRGRSVHVPRITLVGVSGPPGGTPATDHGARPDETSPADGASVGGSAERRFTVGAVVVREVDGTEHVVRTPDEPMGLDALLELLVTSARTHVGREG